MTPGDSLVRAVARGLCSGSSYLLLVIVFVSASAGTRLSHALEIVVPAYFYPSAGSPWNRMNAAAARVDITAIMNPFNGPGSSPDSKYTAAVDSLRGAGGRVIGYVYSGYTARPLAEVYADIDRYADWYAIDGIFVDEMSNTGSAGHLDYYESIYNYVKAKSALWEVMGNPGTSTLETYLTRPTADRLMVFENVGDAYPNYSPSSWNAGYDAASFVHLVHTEASLDAMEAHLRRAISYHAGAIYVTDDVLANPWDTLPSYWDAEVEAVARLNEPRAPLLTLSNPREDGHFTIDASRMDWSGIEAYPNDLDSAPFPGPEIDYQQVTLANDSTHLYARFLFEDTYTGMPPTLNIRHNLYLDTDGDRETGFIGGAQSLAVGAEYLLQGKVLYAFSGDTPISSSWTPIMAVTENDSPTTDVELAIPLHMLDDPWAVDFVVNATNSVTADYLPNAAVAGSLGGFYRYRLDSAMILPGDYNDDSVVDAADYATWRDHLGAPAGTLANDIDGGTIDSRQYATWRLRFGSSLAGSTSASSALVPEPVAIVSWSLGAVALMLRRTGSRATAHPPNSSRKMIRTWLNARAGGMAIPRSYGPLEMPTGPWRCRNQAPAAE